MKTHVFSGQGHTQEEELEEDLYMKGGECKATNRLLMYFINLLLFP